MFWMTMREMARVTKLEGWIFATTPHAGHYHPYPGDNWRFMHDSGAALAFWCGKPLYGQPAYPLALNETYLGHGGWSMEEIAIAWRRVSTPATAFTLKQLGMKVKMSGNTSVHIKECGSTE